MPQVVEINDVNIAVCEQPVGVRNSEGFYGHYDCLNVQGNQVCFRALLYTGKDKFDRLHWSESRRNPLGMRISEHIPISLFYGKKEGDLVVLTYKNEEGNLFNVNVKLSQRDYMEKNFEDVLYERTTGFGGIYSPSEENDLTRIQQYCLMISSHIYYAYSLGKNPEDPTTFRFSSGWVEECREEGRKEPKLSFMEMCTNAMSNDPTLNPVERLGNAIETVTGKDISKVIEEYQEKLFHN